MKFKNFCSCEPYYCIHFIDGYLTFLWFVFNQSEPTQPFWDNLRFENDEPLEFPAYCQIAETNYQVKVTDS